MIQGNIGYVSLVLSDENIKMKSCILKNANTPNLVNLIENNLSMLDKIFDYNFKHKIHLFRISSEIIPFASHEIFTINLQESFGKELKKLSLKAKKFNLRLSMHVGQYTLLTTTSESILNRSIADLKYHCDFLNLLEQPSSSKVIIHVGGIYGNKDEAIKRFINNYKDLSKDIKKRLVIENDDKSYTVSDCLYISAIINIPVVFDYLHWQLNHTEEESDYLKLIEKCAKTWKNKDGLPKIHYSQQAKNKIKGSHSDTISKYQFLKFYNSLTMPADIMLEVKDKDISARKCINWIKNDKEKT